jgi:SAM-dependent methyltransferase
VSEVQPGCLAGVVLAASGQRVTMKGNENMLTRIRKIVLAVARNQAKRLLGGAVRGGHRTSVWGSATRAAHAREIYHTVAPHLGPVVGKVGLEIGPGDNLDVCSIFVTAGASRMLAVERFAHNTAVPPGVELVQQEIETLNLPLDSIDFAYSNDVFEHVQDVAGAFKAVFATLRPGGLFVNSIDLRGHNSYSDPTRPLEHLTCPDWLYQLMHSHVVTSNRISASEFADAASDAGFLIEGTQALATAEQKYLDGLRPRLAARWRDLPNDDLGVVQLLLVLRKPN